MDSRLLECFLRVAELGSINRAAADLNLSQPALSRHVAALEREMGAELFSRSHGGVRLTDAGQLLAERLRPLLRQFALLKQQVGEKAAGQLSVGISPSWHHVFTTEFVAAMVEQSPGVSLRVHEDVSHVLRDHMMAGLLDLCIAPFDASRSAGYRQTALVREPLVLVGALDDKLRPDAPATVTALDGKRLVLPGRSNSLRNQIENGMIRKGLQFRLALETDTLAVCMDFARLGTGYTVVPAGALCEPGLGDSVSWTPLRGMYLTWALYENEDRSHSQAVIEGRRLALRMVTRSLKAGRWHGVERAGGSGTW